VTNKASCWVKEGIDVRNKGMMMMIDDLVVEQNLRSNDQNYMRGRVRIGFWMK
jgi:hypothetical protein